MDITALPCQADFSANPTPEPAGDVIITIGITALQSTPSLVAAFLVSVPRECPDAPVGRLTHFKKIKGCH